VVEYLQEAYNGLNRAIMNDVASRHSQAKSLLLQINNQATQRLSKEKQQLTHNSALLEKVSPYAAFKRGFALVQNEAGRAVTEAKQLKIRERLTLHWADGKAVAEVIEQ